MTKKKIEQLYKSHTENTAPDMDALWERIESTLEEKNEEAITSKPIRRNISITKKAILAAACVAALIIVPVAVRNMDISNSDMTANSSEAIADEMADKPTEFELITALAFEYFSRHNCDVVILEAGMGGRLDSTNVIPTSLLSVITGISLEHTAYLGDTVEKIAAEKAGIIKKNGTVLFGGADGACARVIAARAKEMNADFAVIDKSTLNIVRSDLFGSVFNCGGRKELAISLSGLYQPQNAANVIAAVEALNEKGFSISEDALRRGLLAARWQARFEVISRTPLVIFDGAHNPEGIAAAKETLDAYFKDGVVLVGGILADKDYKDMAGILSAVADRVFAVTPNSPRALSSAELAKTFSSLGIEAKGFDRVFDGVEAAYEYAKTQNIPLVMLGSLYMYGEVYNSFQKTANKRS